MQRTMLTIEQRAELDAVMRKRRGNALGAPCAVRCAVERRRTSSRYSQQARLQRRVRLEVDFGVRGARAGWAGVFASWSRAEDARGQA